MEKHIKIYTGTSIIINRLAYLLDEINIHFIIKDHKESGRLAGFGAIEGSTELFIYNDDAKKLVKSLKILKKKFQNSFIFY
ncbi:DUF2007 domain-containing protein [Aquimarina sp. AD1]|uniref:DUF2007 domain-containing protein n=1 Tax=Aquimarina sp. (strain AD1) TaxID=1714848 RepID=UPI000EAA786A|nr:DUF2007 domain-containing protein [Aquimarina sp. AD1]RKN11222.1 DUF2007 domain-containing protein [Aquimarina sp. AD1]